MTLKIPQPIEGVNRGGKMQIHPSCGVDRCQEVAEIAVQTGTVDRDLLSSESDRAGMSVEPPNRRVEGRREVGEPSSADRIGVAKHLEP